MMDEYHSIWMRTKTLRIMLTGKVQRQEQQAGPWQFHTEDQHGDKKDFDVIIWP
jgi:hypothetical protein